MRHLTRVAARVQVVQIDSVSAVIRSHYLPFFSRLGPYRRELLDAARDRAPRRLVEYWAHEASLLPPATWPLLAFRMRRADDEAWGGMRRVSRDHPQLVAAVLAEVGRRGPMTSRQVEAALAHDLPRTREHWGWNWSLVKQALEHLFWSGQISSAGRTAQFERRYALPEVVAPAPVRPAWQARDALAEPDAVLQLMRLATRALGIGTAACFRDYFRLTGEHTRLALQTLVREGTLVPVDVPGWRGPVWMHAEAAMPRAIDANTVLSPFDSLIWRRERTAALFGFRFRLEIYVPPAQRRYGYYVLPYLYGDELVARCDMRADRAAGVLRVRSFFEPGAPAAAAAALPGAVAELAGWLGLEEVQWQD